MRALWMFGVSACATAPLAEAPVAEHHPHAAAVPCSTGCSGASPADEPLGDAQITELLADMAQHPVGAPEIAAETLLFHGVEVLDFLDRTKPAATEHLDWLRHELSRDRVEVGMRLVSDDGEVLGWRDDVVDLATKYHLLLQGTGALGRADVNGKVKRVGVKHLWARY